jgi:hypothetical protein
MINMVKGSRQKPVMPERRTLVREEILAEQIRVKAEEAAGPERRKKLQKLGNQLRAIEQRSERGMA